MPQHRTVEVNGLRLHLVEEGEGPLVLLLHGFPEFWYAWRHQLRPLAEAGFRVVAPDQRGYGDSDRPAAPEAYSVLHLAGDVVGLIRALGEERAVVAGHDWGALVAWQSALLRPDVVRAVAGLSILPMSRGPVPPLRAMRERTGGRFYWNYFEEPGVAEAEFGKDLDRTFRRLLYGASGDRQQPPAPPLVPPGGGFLDLAADPETLPGWLTEEDITAYVTAFERSGFTGGLNWYRNLDRNWELTAAWQDARIEVPALFVVGDRDRAFPGDDKIVPALSGPAPHHHEPVIVRGAGHWVQQERPEAVNAALVGFLRSLG
ncbi:pimeloyl-ACP methyl ester carboxylesterase [Streptomyces sp. BK208]|uniref:alpha/beta fold hydrolase n=1 Tax=Streptomyces sp. BK208 TaxID=2512150 RepID=UPI00105D09F0|nr:alpha/beta hydrolase [Streptomyces sp. BK208]TDT42700.1 pimeloyl-ACP methyl ester carboxylesterase [Streptomyces sp. BK208]